MSVPKSKDRAIVAQGGGVRSAFSAGAVNGLDRSWMEAAGFGSSAGAISLAYFLCGQAQDLEQMFFENMLQRGIVKPARFWRIIDVDGLIEMLRTAFPLKVPPGGLQLTVSVVDVSDGSQRYIDLSDAALSDIYQVLGACAAVPILYGSAVQVGGSRYVDGGLLDTLPVKPALEAGFRRLLVLSTRPLSYRRRQKSWIERTSKAALAFRTGSAVGKLLGREDPDYNDLMSGLEGGRYGERVQVLAPPRSLITGRTETDMDAVRRLWDEGLTQGQQVL